MHFIIPNLFNKVDTVTPQKLFWYVLAASMLLAGNMQYIQHGWINADTVLYFEQARLIALGDWSGAISVFNWPLYGACIAAVHSITNLSIHQSAQLLNIIFFGIATASYLTIIQLAGGGTRVMLAATLLLFGSQYIVGDVLEMLMRDEGFWAFYLSGIVFLIRYIQHHQFSDALLWQLSMIIATLFRIEAICYLIGLPLCFLLITELSWKDRILYLRNTYSVAIISLIAIASILLINDELSMHNFGRLQEVFSPNLYHEFTQKLLTKAQIMSEQVLGKYLEEFALIGLLLTFVYVMIIKTISATGIFAAFFAGLTFTHHGSNIESKAYLVLKTSVFIALISMALIIVKVFVLSGRYVIGLSWILLILGAFYFSTMLASKKERTALTASLIVVVLCLGLVKNILPKRQGYNYMQEAVAWVNINNTQHLPVLYDEKRLRYYANAPFLNEADDWETLTKKLHSTSIQDYGYIVVSHSRKYPERRQYLREHLRHHQEVASFNSVKSKNSIVIYQRK